MRRTSIAIAVVMAVIAAGCRRRVETFGSEIPASDATPIVNILAEPLTHTGMPVVVEGRITQVCPAGCWFELSGEGASLHVDLAGAGLAIPQRMGKDARVVGTLSAGSTRVSLAGQGVEIK
jgi:hypothetical protein